MTPLRLVGSISSAPDPDHELVRLLYEQHAAALYAFSLRWTGDVQRALEVWSAVRLAGAMQAVRRTELACKQTGAQDALLIRQLLLEIARHAAAATRGGRD